MTTPGIKNIIFDLGGVIINLSVEKTHQAFSVLSGKPIQQIRSIVQKSPFFNQYEKGMIDDETFRDQLREVLSDHLSDAELDHAWNAMLLDIPMERIHLLEHLKSRFNIYLLSNTNNIHLQCFNKQVQQLTGFVAMDQYFHQAYYSHIMKMRKPDVEIYEYVLHAHDLVPHETIFLDDNKDNLLGANNAGIKTFHVEHPDQIYSLF